jgi:catechol 2,3-dioxygenase-like lactoylglutathione lyase family enzyme
MASDLKRLNRKAATALLSAWVLCLAAYATAQLAAPNQAGVSMSHLHYRVRDVEANRRFWIALGGLPSGRLGEAEILKFPDVLVLVERGESFGGTEGSVLNHVAFRVPSLASVEAAGLVVTRLKQFPGVASVTSPEGERVELFEDAALNLTFTSDAGGLDAVTSRHNRPLAVPVAFHHVHLHLPNEQAVGEAKSWYTRMFGGVPGKRAQYEAVDLPGININLGVAPRPTAPTRGRMLDHIGFEVSDLETFSRTLESRGVRFEVPYVRSGGGTARAVIVDPWGTTIELTEGLR